jgi:hypothetical protein
MSLPNSTELQPDVVIARRYRSRYEDKHPGEDILPPVEIAETSLSYAGIWMPAGPRM